MTKDDEIRIERALQNQAMGLPLSSDDLWCLKVHERHEQRQQRGEVAKLDTIFVDETPAALDADGILNEKLADDIGYTLAEISSELRVDYTARLRKLELTIARLEGEMRAMRAIRANDAVVPSKSIGDAIEK